MLPCLIVFFPWKRPFGLEIPQEVIREEIAQWHAVSIQTKVPEWGDVKKSAAGYGSRFGTITIIITIITIIIQNKQLPSGYLT